jgi:hypothetical protein
LLKTEKFAFLSKYLKILQPIASMSMALFIYIFILLNRSPGLLRPISMVIRTGYTIVFPVMLLVLYLTFRLRGWIGSLLSPSVTLAIFALGLAGLWASGLTESGILSGVVPMFDSTSYYLDGLRMLQGQAFSVTSTRRPFFSAFFGVMLAISDHNLMIALSIVTLFAAVGCYLLSREIQRTHGPILAAFALAVIFMYFRYHSGAVRTETLGVILSALGTTAIWKGLADSKQRYVLIGIFLTALALVTRAGAFFVLPLLVLWGAWYFRGSRRWFSWEFLLFGAGGIALVFLLNQVVVRFFGSPDVVAFGNFSYSLYGLASGGKSWAYVFEAHPELATLADADKSSAVYRLAFDLILHRPNLFMRGVLFNWSMFFSSSGYGAYSFMSGENSFINTLSAYVLFILGGLGLLKWFIKRDDPFAGFVGVSTIGILLSVPFLPPTDAFRMRVFASSIVIFALLPAMGLDFILRRLNLTFLTPTFPENQTPVVWFSVPLIVLMIAGPFVLKGSEGPLQVDSPTSCVDGSTALLVRFDPGTSINIVRQSEPLLDWVPDFHRGTFRMRVHDFPNPYFISWADRLPQGTTLFYALDQNSYRQALIVASSDSIPNPPAKLAICGQWETTPEIANFNVFYAEAVNKE